MNLETLIWDNTIKNYLIALVIMALSIGIGKLFSLVIIAAIKQLTKKTETLLDDILIHVLEKPLIFAVFIIGFYYALSYLVFGTRGETILTNVFYVLIVTNIMWAVMKLCDALIEFYLVPMTEKTVSKFDDQILAFARKLVKVFIFLLALIFVLAHFGFNVTSLIAGLGIGGLAFALAAQPLLSNLFGGLTIMADKPFDVGDKIKIEGKFEGHVKEIGMRSTLVQTTQGTTITIPNSIITTTAVENMTKNNESTRTNYTITLASSTTSSQLDEAINTIKKILHDNKCFENAVDFSEFKDAKPVLQLNYSVKVHEHHENIATTRTAVNLAIKKSFEEKGIVMA